MFYLVSAYYVKDKGKPASRENIGQWKTALFGNIYIHFANACIDNKET